MTTFPGGGDSFGGSIRDKYYGGGPNIPVTAERTGTVQGMGERDGNRIVGIPQGDTAWAGGRVVMDLGRLSHGRQTADVSDGLSDQGRAAELPSGGLPRTGRDEDGDVGALLQPACPVYRDHLGGGKPPPPKMSTM